MENIFLKRLVVSAVALPLVLATSSVALAQTSSSPTAQGKTEVLWFGQAGFRIKTPKEK